MRKLRPRRHDRHDGYTDGTNRWTAGGGGNNVSAGWSIYRTVSSDTAQSAAKPAASPPVAKPKKIRRIRVPAAAMPAGEIIYKRSVFDAAGVLVVQEGKITAGPITLLPVGPLHLPRESFSYRHTFVDESRALRARAGEITVAADLRLQIGIVKLEGSVDGEALKDLDNPHSCWSEALSAFLAACRTARFMKARG